MVLLRVVSACIGSAERLNEREDLREEGRVWLLHFGGCRRGCKVSGGISAQLKSLLKGMPSTGQDSRPVLKLINCRVTELGMSGS